MSSPSDDNGGGPPPNSSAFTPSQIERYLRHVSFPLPPSHPRDARFLRTLHQCQITSIPYENLSLHYNPSHSNSIDPQRLYAKFIPDGPAGQNPAKSEEHSTTTSRGRGGFCFETSVFFLHVLRGLGFTAYPTAARIRIRDHLTRVPSGPFVGPRHGRLSTSLYANLQAGLQAGFWHNLPLPPPPYFLFILPEYTWTKNR